MSDIEKVDKYLEEGKVFFLATVDGDKPKVRPLGFHLLYNDKIYFGVGTFKEVYKQMVANPKVEINSLKADGQGFLRYYGEVEFDDNEEVVEKAFEAMPMLKEIYNEETGFKLGMFYLKNATAEFRSMMEIEEKIEF